MKNYLSALLLCGFIPQAAFAAAAAPLALDDAWVRALPPGQPNTAGYVTVTNNGSTGITIIGGRAPVARALEIHTTREVEGYQRMEQLSEVRIAPGESRAFTPGGMHLMLLGLERMPAVGEQVLLCLILIGGEEACTMAEVRKSAGGGKSHDHH